MSVRHKFYIIFNQLLDVYKHTTLKAINKQFLNLIGRRDGLKAIRKEKTTRTKIYKRKLGSTKRAEQNIVGRRRIE